MLLWRLTRERHLEAALTGEGARLFGGRWNSRGVAVVYAAQSLELALLEGLVHVDVEAVPRDYWQLSFEVPDDLIASPPSRLPKGWDAPPPYQPAVQRIGDAWARSKRSLALRVPASVLPARFNVLVNPAHPDIGQVREVSRARLAWPPRLIGHFRDRSPST
jgi:RES domain-containing protein